jgi:gamma-glutamyltranspeptidase/glutathione hydrolase
MRETFPVWRREWQHRSANEPALEKCVHRLIPLCLLLLCAPANADTDARRGMVAAAHPLAVAAGVEILHAGGSAIDAAVAVQMVLSLVEPQASGIGGGAFLLHFDAGTGQTTSWDGRETAPAAVRPDLFLDRDGKPMAFIDAVLGGRSVGVPGTLRMLEAAWKQHGKLPWADLFAPAIRLATEGFPISARLANSIVANAGGLGRQAEARRFFTMADGSPLPEGTVLRNPALAETLRTIAAGGADALYRGPIAADIAAAVRTDPNPGLMTTDDLAAYQAKERPPVCGEYRQHQVCGMGPPSSGGVAVLQILGMLSHENLPDMDPDGLKAAHLILDAMRLAYADRDRFLADSDYVAVPVPGLLDAGYLAERAKLLDPARAIALPMAGDPSWVGAIGPAAVQPNASQAPSPEHGTSHMAIVDDAGDAVSMTSTVEGPFGSHLMVRGFMLNNQLTDFAFLPVVDGRPVANRAEPGKRPRSSMAPSLVFDADGKLRAAIGSQGGSRIIGFVSLALVRMLDWHLTPQQAAAAPRMQTMGGTVELEAGTTAAGLADGLTALGHTVRVMRVDSGLQAIAIGADRMPSGGADPRREGVAVGN